MLILLKKALPLSLRKILSVVKRKTIDHIVKIRFSDKVSKQHTAVLNGLQNANSIKVVFLAIHKSIWKVDPVFRKMLKDPFFEPTILVCPYLEYGQKRMLEDLEETYNFF